MTQDNEKPRADTVERQQPAAPQPAASPAGWWTAEERETIDAMAALELFLSRASSPPVVEVPVID